MFATIIINYNYSCNYATLNYGIIRSDSPDRLPGLEAVSVVVAVVGGAVATVVVGVTVVVGS